MAASRLIIIFIAPAWLHLILCPSCGMEVLQPANRTVNPDRTVSIHCEHTVNESAHISIIDVRLNRMPGMSMVCQRGQKCKDIVFYQEKPKCFIFILLNVGAESLSHTYQCEFTTKTKLHGPPTFDQLRGRPTKLLPGPVVAQDVSVPICPSPSSPPPPQHPNLTPLRWVLIGLLAAVFIYSCVITALYIRLRVMRSEELYDSLTYVPMQPNQHQPVRRPADPESSSTYMDMRKVRPGGRASRVLSTPSG